MKKDITKIFIDEIYSTPLRKIYPYNRLINDHIDEIWNIDLADMIDYKISNNEIYRYIFIIIDNFSKYLWTTPLKNKYSKTITDEFWNFLKTSKRKLLKLESDGGSEFYNSIFQNFLKSKHIHHCSRLTDKGPSIAERVFRTIRNLLKKPLFGKGNANWISEFPSVAKQNDKTIHSSIKMTLINLLKNQTKS